MGNLGMRGLPLMQPDQALNYSQHETVAPDKSNIKRYFFMTAVALAIIIGYLTIVIIDMRTSAERTREYKASLRRNIEQYIRTEKSNPKYLGSESKPDLNISVINSCEYLIDEVKVKASYIKANGGVWKEEYLTFNHLQPFSKKTQEVPDKVSSIRYDIVSIKSAELEMY